MGTDKQFVKSRIKNYAQAAGVLMMLYGCYLVYGSAGQAADDVSNVWNNWLNVHLGLKCESLPEDQYNSELSAHSGYCKECSLSPASNKQKVVTAVFRGYFLCIVIACLFRMTALANLSAEDLKKNGYKHKGRSKDLYVMSDLIRRCDGFRVWMLLFSPIFLTMDLYYKIVLSILGVLNAKVSFTAVKKVAQKPFEQWRERQNNLKKNPSWWKLPPLPDKLESVLPEWRTSHENRQHPLHHYADPLLVEIFNRKGPPNSRQIFSYAGYLYCTDGVIAARVPVKSNPFPTKDHNLIRLAHLFEDRQYEMPIYHLTSIGMSESGCSMDPMYHSMVVKHGLVWAQVNRNDHLIRCSAGGHTSLAEMSKEVIVAAWHDGDPEPGHDALFKACAE